MKKLTLLELLIIIAIIGILLSLLLPSLSKSREKVKRAVCLSNLSQSHIANMAYAANSENIIPPGNAVLDPAQGVDSVYRFATNMAFGAALPYHTGYTDTPNYLYCPSWEHPYMKKNTLNGGGQYGGYTDEGYTKPTLHYMTSYNYRGVFEGVPRSPNLLYDDSLVPYMGDHWTNDWGKYVHTLDGYNILYVDGHAKFNRDKTKTVLLTATDHRNHALQGLNWDVFFKE
ncbi:MAG: hypothetical protein NE330_06765 [Lentisphaeraceae bacterium]|nr:hypothetical protein [Lentisphaeraceae bacterium]